MAAKSASAKREAAIAALRAERGISPHAIAQLAELRGLSAEHLRTMPEAAFRRALRRLQYPDLPLERDRFRLLHLQVDPAAAAGAPPRGGRRLRALRHQDSLRARVAGPAVAGVPVGIVASPAALSPLPQPAPGGIDPRAWSALGPANVGGRTRCILPDPDHPGRLWVGSAGGGIWRSEDDGGSWLPVDDLMANLAVCCLAMAPLPDDQGRRALYAGTGEGFRNGDAIRGAGIFCSQDGTLWAPLAATGTADFLAVNRIAIAADGGTMLAATPAGLFRSTAPGFAAWSSVLQAAIADVRCHPADPQLAIAGGLTDGNAYYSTDGGASWNPARHAVPWGSRIELTYAAADPTIVYASVNLAGGQVWRSRDGGKRYTRMKTQTADGQPVFYLGNQGWYANAIWAGDPGDANAVLLGGLDLWRSRDGGDSLQQISLWYAPASVHADHHCIVGRPAAAKTVYFGNDGGIFRADDYTTVGGDPDRTAGWTRLDNGYGVTQLYGGAGNAQSGTITGGAQDNGTVTYLPAGGAAAWTTMFGGDGGWCASDPADPNCFYGEYVFCQIHRSQDGGRSSDYICGQYWDAARRQWSWKPAPYLIPDAQTQRALFIAPFALDPSKPRRLLAGGMALWRTEDAKAANDEAQLTGPSWASIKDGIGDAISAIAIAPANSDVIWVGHAAGELFTTGNGTAGRPTWRQVGGNGAFPLAIRRYCSSILIAPENQAVVCVTFAAYHDGADDSNVWRSADGGASWQDIGRSLPDVPVHKVSRHPASGRYLYVGTEIGLYASDDGGITWSPTNEGPTNCPVYDIFWLDQRLVCTTHGRGMFAIDIAAP
jgi:photosystem II stability/assembly factor-like uncharacterized protein